MVAEQSILPGLPEKDVKAQRSSKQLAARRRKKRNRYYSFLRV